MYSKWFAVPDGGKLRVKRYQIANRSKWQRLPAIEYSHLSEPEIRSLVTRLNASRVAQEKLAKERYEFDHAFINTKIIDSFETFLRAQANNEHYIRDTLERLNKVVLHFFVLKSKLPDPKLWPKKQEAFGQYLLELGLAANSIKQNVQLTNRFVEFLSMKFPGEVFPIKIHPVGKKKLQHLDATSASSSRAKYIDEDAFKKIMKVIDPRIHACVELAYKLGFRRRETLGAEEENIFEDSFHVRRQLIKLDDGSGQHLFGPLKNKQVRDIEYWFTTPEEVFELLQKRVYLNPDTVGRLFSEGCKAAGLDFQFHDLRRSFASRANDAGKKLTDIQKALGHFDIKTTMLYIQDTRKLTRKRWKPGGPDGN